MNHRSCVNGILAAVLSASVVPIHGALAQPKPPAAERPAPKLPATLPTRPEWTAKEAAKNEAETADDE